MDTGFTDPNQLRVMLDRTTPGTHHAKLGSVVTDLINYTTTLMLSKAGLAIHGASSPIVKAATAFVAVASGKLVRKAANTDMAAVAGTIPTAQSGAWAFYINSAGTLSSSFSGAAATHDAALAALTAPAAGNAMIGIVAVDNASGSNFVGGTTAFDAGSLTVTYYDTVSAVFPVGALGTR